MTSLLGLGQLSLSYREPTSSLPARFALEASLLQGRRINIGVGSVTGGVVGVQWSPNGSFLLDFGFPWAQRGSPRQWQRALTVWFGVLQMSGGIYLEVMYVDELEIEGVKVETRTLGFGLAGQFGYGIAKSIDAVVTISALARVGIYAVVEGSIITTITDGKEKQEFTFSGAVGVLAEVRIRINAWCISLEAYVIATAEVVVRYPAKLSLADGDLLGLEECRYLAQADRDALAIHYQSAPVMRAAAAPLQVEFALRFEVGFVLKVDLGVFTVNREFTQPLDFTISTTISF